MDGLEFFFEEAESGLVPRVDAGDVLGGGIDVVESVVASINEARGQSSYLISSEPMDGGSGKEQFRGVDGMVPHTTTVAMGSLVTQTIWPLRIRPLHLWERRGMPRVPSSTTQRGPVGLDGNDPAWSAGGPSQTRAEALDKGCKGYTPSRVSALP
ncbi:uncharacterized protein [Aegilops tauschii subsp. strangulata]|uniref:uncharacterized protein n=1 Tax=Aegilops tauschii subsp. strangulata TaxID=200361 RepID=UPI001ABBEDA1|nr:uncharacterized protein LOC120975780 [Aegilops tauschii subsp. strangulata]